MSQPVEGQVMLQPVDKALLVDLVTTRARELVEDFSVVEDFSLVATLLFQEAVSSLLLLLAPP